jgi:hypothetical protein
LKSKYLAAHPFAKVTWSAGPVDLVPHIVAAILELADDLAIHLAMLGGSS